MLQPTGQNTQFPASLAALQHKWERTQIPQALKEALECQVLTAIKSCHLPISLTYLLAAELLWTH